MNCPRCGAANPAEARFCGRCGAALPVPGPSSSIPGLSGTESSVSRSAGGILGILVALLAAAGLGVVADYIMDRVTAKIANCACGCLFFVGFVLCILVFGVGQSLFGR